MSAEITIYGRPHCTNCTKTTDALTDAGVVFVYHDISKDPQVRAEAVSYGYLQAPVVVLSSVYAECIATSWSGYDEDKVMSLIKMAAA